MADFSAEIIDLAMKGMYEQAVQALLAEAEEALQTAKRYAVAMAQQMKDRDGVADVHRELGVQMQEATALQYQVSKLELGTGVHPYRMGDRYAGGKMDQMLASSALWESDVNGISFGDIDFMDSMAKQWHRLNFGALGLGHGPGERSQTFHIGWADMGSAALGLNLSEPSKGFFLPAGFFTPMGSFHLESSGDVPPPGSTWAEGLPLTSGIKAWNFFDAGVRVLSERIAPKYDGLIQGWADTANTKAGPSVRFVTPVQTRIKVFV